MAASSAGVRKFSGAATAQVSCNNFVEGVFVKAVCRTCRHPQHEHDPAVIKRSRENSLAGGGAAAADAARAAAEAQLHGQQTAALAEIENVAADAVQEIVAKVAGLKVDQQAAAQAVKTALAA